jgi:hypothetical protein
VLEEIDSEYHASNLEAIFDLRNRNILDTILEFMLFALTKRSVSDGYEQTGIAPTEPPSGPSAWALLHATMFPI